jgi:hypothetical protein
MIPPRTTNSTAPIAGQMISPARLDTKKQCSTGPRWTPIFASGASTPATVTARVARSGPARRRRDGTFNWLLPEEEMSW